MKTNFLKEALSEESRAYGFTIGFWGSGTLLINSHGLPILSEALAYGAGAIFGFGLLTLMAYNSVLRQSELNRSNHPALSMVHYIAALLPIVIASFTADLSALRAFFITGASVTVVYNLGMVVEEELSNFIVNRF